MPDFRKLGMGRNATGVAQAVDDLIEEKKIVRVNFSLESTATWSGGVPTYNTEVLPLQRVQVGSSYTAAIPVSQNLSGNSAYIKRYWLENGYLNVEVNNQASGDYIDFWIF